MREFVEVRMEEEDAKAMFGDEDVGRTIGTRPVQVRKIELPIGDLRLARVCQWELDSVGSSGPILYWNVRRSYTAHELVSAEMLQLRPKRMFEPAGEECGTQYDYSDTCPECGAGRKLLGDLALRVSTIPKSADFAFTIARDEFVVSSKFRELVEANLLTGIAFRPVIDRRTGLPSESWFRLVFTSQPLETDGCTVYTTGDPCDPHRSFHGKPGHVVGNRIVSEARVPRKSWDGSDFARSHDLVGGRRGLIAPWPLLFASGKAYRLMHESGIKGLGVEVAHVVDPGCPPEDHVKAELAWSQRLSQTL